MTLSKLSWEEPTEDYIGWLVYFEVEDPDLENWYSVITKRDGTSLIGSCANTEEKAIEKSNDKPIWLCLDCNIYKIIPIRKIF